jgi:LytS/YehU family sensor histidine kinase
MPWRKDPEKEWVLESTQNFVQFEFNAMVHNNSHQNRYSYQLVGYDTGWQSNQTNQTKSYTNLSPGHYEFKLVACNNDGLAAKPIYFKFYVKPPFYFTWWFITSCLVMLFTMIYIIYRFKVQQIKREEALKTAFNKELANIEMKALRAQMNPHFIFNSLNSIQKFILSNQHFEASQYLTKFSRLIRLILDHAKEDMITLASEIETLSIYIGLEQMRFEDVFSYELRVDPLLNPETTLLPSMLIQPYIENAIRHGLLHRKLPGKLTVRFNFKTSHEMEVIILDDGIGRQQSAALKGKNEVKQKSYGMKITQDRLNNFNKIKNTQGSVQVLDVMNDQQVCIGTQVILVIPIQKLNQ